jgi:hypothetical protein
MNQFFIFSSKGMEVTVHNLIKKSANVYKSNSALNVLSAQTLDLYNQDSKGVENMDAVVKSAKNPNAPGYLHECLLENTSQIFNTLYAPNSDLLKPSTSSSDTNRVGLLFGGESSNTGATNGSEHKFLAQIMKIYDLNLKIKCAVCASLLNSCVCKPKSENFRVELIFSFLIDDHTSILRLNYSNMNYSYGQSSSHSNIFKPISAYLTSILKSYLNEITLPTIPVPNLNSFSEDSGASARLYHAFKEKTAIPRSNFTNNNTNNTTNGNNTIDSTLFGVNSESYFFENQVKLDICKTLYDYLLFTVLDKYFVFYVDLNEASNVREICKQRAPPSSTNFKSKSELSFFKLSELENNEQFKSMLTLTCAKFVPIELEFGS